jgi:hypothetical protein
MTPKSIARLSPLALFVLALLAGAAAQAPPQQPPAESNAQLGETERPAKKTTKLHIVVKSGEDSKPVAAAQVDVIQDDADFSIQVHTDSDGIADMVVPRGKVLIQVIAAHFAVGGASQTLQSEKQTVEIKLSVQAAHN